MDNSLTTITAAPAAHRGWRKRIGGKPLGEIVTDFTLFVMGVAILYGVDSLIISRAAPFAFHYLIDLAIYFSGHAAAAVEIFN